NTSTVTRPFDLYASLTFWKYASSLSQPEQPQVRRSSTGPLAVSLPRSISLPLASLILNAGAGWPTSILATFAGLAGLAGFFCSAARARAGTAARRNRAARRWVTRHLRWVGRATGRKVSIPAGGGGCKENEPKTDDIPRRRSCPGSVRVGVSPFPFTC